MALIDDFNPVPFGGRVNMTPLQACPSGSIKMWLEIDQGRLMSLINDDALSHWWDLSKRWDPGGFDFSDNDSSPPRMRIPSTPSGRPSANFNGTNAHLFTFPGTNTLFTTAYTIGIVVMCPNVGNASNTNRKVFQHGVGDVEGISLGIDGNGRWRCVFEGVGGAWFGGGSGNRNANDGKFHVITMATPSPSLTPQLRIDGQTTLALGAESTGTDGVYNPPNPTTATISLGKNWSSNITANSWAKCDYCAIFVSDRFILLPELQKIERMWGSKYGVSVG